MRSKIAFPITIPSILAATQKSSLANQLQLNLQKVLSQSQSFISPNQGLNISLMQRLIHWRRSPPASEVYFSSLNTIFTSLQKLICSNWLLLDISIFSRSTSKQSDFPADHEIRLFSKFNRNHLSFSWKLRPFISFGVEVAIASGIK